MPTFSDKKTSTVVMVAAGASLGLLSVFSPGTVFTFFAALLAILMIGRLSTKDDRKFLIGLFIAGLSVRVLLVLMTQFILITHGRWVFQMGDAATCLFGDDAYYTLRSWWIAKTYLGEPVSRMLLQAAFTSEGLTGYLYSTSLFYYVFGLSPVSWIFVNCIFSALTGIVYYSIASQTAGIKAAKIAGLLVVFFPSMIEWSIINLKDSSFIFFTSLILWAFVKLLNSNKARFLLFLLGALTLQLLIRPNFIDISIISILILGFCYFLAKRKLKILPIIILVIILAVNFPVLKKAAGNLTTRIINYHQGVVFTNGFNYRLYDDWVYEKSTDTSRISSLEVIKIIPKALAHFFFEPFPWKMRSALSLISLPQMLAWYILALFGILGAFIQLKTDWRKNLFFPAYFLGIGTILALTGGNIGTSFRLRDMLSPIVLYFAAIAFARMICFKTDAKEG